jgi:hypothetical protein
LLDLAGNGKLTQSSNGLKVDTNTISPAELTASVAGAGLVGGNGTALAVQSDAGTGSIGGDTPASWTGIGLVTVTADAVGVNLGSGSTEAAPGNHTHKASAITFAAGTTGIAATEVQTAIELIDGRVDTLETNGSALQTEVNAIETGLGASFLSTGVYDVGTFSGTNYLGASSDITDALKDLDTATKAVETSLTTKVNNMYYLYVGGTAGTTHTVTHALGQKYCNVTCIDAATDEVIIPQSIVFDTASQLTVTLNSALDIKVVVMGLA